MAEQLSYDGMVRSLRALGVPLDKAQRRASELTGQAAAPLPDLPAVVRRTVALPFSLVVPWSHLCSDNDKESGRVLTRGGRQVPGKVLTPRYKASKANIRSHAADVAGEVDPVEDEPLAIEVRVWLPPARRNDPLNFGKVIHDALEGVVYANDNQLHRIEYQRAGVDIDAPRAEVTITRLA